MARILRFALWFTSMPTFERIIPVLTYQDIPAAHDFLCEAFGFVAGGVYRTPEGMPIHGEVRAGDTAIWLHRVTAEHQLDSPLATPVSSSMSMMSTHTTSARAPRAPGSTASRLTSPTASASTARATRKVTDGGLQPR